MRQIMPLITIKALRNPQGFFFCEQTISKTTYFGVCVNSP
ncbi:MAG TPA: hypothetical protein DEB17_04630 [Chlorobaculum sp.]|uniref:Uncharacterized protein n=1 Tax=Chlorobaculum tepidum (strain ATCC 49652 / DSM 12025 / NBRC 103806 / TLS) TaxID=194439 RepID=Q8KB42_CHLTE|nr:hypothetical protein CT1952 [Chlorobaculum tepidum TLS]HBU23269.1 hypothetical protein [Chlorobaculum sp.]